jgi:hypothetical protein
MTDTKTNNPWYIMTRTDQIFSTYKITRRTDDGKFISFELILARNAIEAYIVALERGYRDIEGIEMYEHD